MCGKRIGKEGKVKSAVRHDVMLGGGKFVRCLAVLNVVCSETFFVSHVCERISFWLKMWVDLSVIVSTRLIRSG